MKKEKTLIVIFFTILCNVTLFAQSDSSKIEFDFSLRERFESCNGMNAKNNGDDGPNAIESLHDKMLLQRFIAGFIYHPAKDASWFTFQILYKFDKLLIKTFKEDYYTCAE